MTEGTMSQSLDQGWYVMSARDICVLPVHPAESMLAAESG